MNNEISCSIAIQGYDNNWTIDNSFTREDKSFDSLAKAEAYVKEYNDKNFKETTDGDNSYYKNGYLMWIE